MNKAGRFLAHRDDRDPGRTQDLVRVLRVLGLLSMLYLLPGRSRLLRHVRPRFVERPVETVGH
jgi:hypothetical protein